MTNPTEKIDRRTRPEKPEAVSCLLNDFIPYCAKFVLQRIVYVRFGKWRQKIQTPVPGIGSVNGSASHVVENGQRHVIVIMLDVFPKDVLRQLKLVLNECNPTVIAFPCREMDKGVTNPAGRNPNHMTQIFVRSAPV